MTRARSQRGTLTIKKTNRRRMLRLPWEDEMATGRMAFPGNTAAIEHEAILNRAPVPEARLKPELPPRLAEVIDKALAKGRKLRYQNAADICTDFQRLKRDSDSARLPAAPGRVVGVGGTATTSGRCWCLPPKQLWRLPQSVTSISTAPRNSPTRTHRPRRFHQQHRRASV
jgi:hypothetical protein